MRYELFVPTLLFSLAISTVVRADVDTNPFDLPFNQPGTADNEGLRSSARSEELTHGYLNDEKVGIKPQIGLLSFTDQTGTSTSRGAYGFTAEGNLAPLISENWKSLFIGPVTGLIYSHLGDPGSSFFGANSATPTGADGANLLMIPLNLKVGYNFTPMFRVAAHGGGNILYQSIGNSLAVGNTTANATPGWSIFPNVGGDIEIGLTQHAALILRPDVTLTPGNSIFTGTIGVNFPIS